jgi:hypothetical protein
VNEVVSNRKKVFIDVIDILFIMILCFVSLLVPMLAQGKVLVGSGGAGGLHYRFKLGTFIPTLLIIGGYIYFVVAQSDKELHRMIETVYGKKNDTKAPLDKTVGTGEKE